MCKGHEQLVHRKETAVKHVKRCSASFIIKVMHIKTTMSCFEPYRTDTNPKAGNKPITRGYGDRYLQGFKMVQP